ncbi:TolC family protein [Flavobacteriaceae bacterium]|jgi:outer membrane protein TolC|nr:TolC family protein [Flavobacteriaceae bacterium]MDB2426304.1 TolC family protein [Flavobacteriaceae bacterium]MDC0462980.1 TolC family protein [Flavobacteriaceae bacterium]MDC3198746.1 TolC family protein [Flavobacteriaceae bacterium]
MLHKFIIFLLFATSLNAQENKYSFTLQEAVDFATDNNRAIQNAERDVKIAAQTKRETTATGLPQINANIGYNNWLEQQVSLIPAGVFGGVPGQFSEVTFGTTQTMNGSINIRQKLFDGSYLVALQAAKVYLEISKNAKEKTTNEIRKVVAYSYGNVLLAEANLEIVDSNIALLEKNVWELSKVYENGLVEEESLQQLQLTLSGLKSNQRYTKRLKNIAYQIFNNSLGLNLNSEVVLTNSLEELVLLYSLLTPSRSENEIEEVIDFKIAVNSVKSDELLLKLEKSKALPSLNAFVNGSYSGNSERFSFTENSQKWFGASLFGVTLDIPVFSSFKRSASTQRARLNLEKSKSNLEETTNKIKLEINTARSNYEFAVEDYEIKKNALDLSKNISIKNEIKFFEGLTTSFDLSQAQRQLYMAQQDHLQSMLNILLKRVELESLINTPLKN